MTARKTASKTSQRSGPAREAGDQAQKSVGEAHAETAKNAPTGPMFDVSFVGRNDVEQVQGDDAEAVRKQMAKKYGVDAESVTVTERKQH
jgi:hypothetical protein